MKATLYLISIARWDLTCCIKRDVSDFKFRKFPHHTTEWSIPYEEAKACLLEIRTWLRRELADSNGLRPHFPVEIRFSSADDIWLSPSNGRRSCWIGMIQFKFVSSISVIRGAPINNLTDLIDLSLTPGHMDLTFRIASFSECSKISSPDTVAVLTGQRLTVCVHMTYGSCTPVSMTSCECFPKLTHEVCFGMNTSIGISLVTRSMSRFINFPPPRYPAMEV
jgi:hypothetical protein